MFINTQRLKITSQTWKNELVPRSNIYGQNSTVIYREQLFRLDPSFSGWAFTQDPYIMLHTLLFLKIALIPL